VLGRENAGQICFPHSGDQWCWKLTDFCPGFDPGFDQAYRSTSRAHHNFHCRSCWSMPARRRHARENLRHAEQRLSSNAHRSSGL